MNKSELITHVQHHLKKRDVSKAFASEAVDAVLATLHHSLAHGGTVQLIGFGTFSVTRRAARTGRNPQTGKGMKIEASNNVRFKTGTALKHAVNGKAATKKAKQKKK